MPTTEEIADEVPHTCYAVHALMATRRLTRFYDNALRPTGLTIMQYALLCVIGYAKPESITALADICATERSTVSRSLTPLENAGYVTRQDETDRRQRPIRLTKEGEAKVTEVYPAWRKAQDALERRLGSSGEEVKSILAALEKTVAEI